MIQNEAFFDKILIPLFIHILQFLFELIRNQSTTILAVNFELQAYRFKSCVNNLN